MSVSLQDNIVKTAHLAPLSRPLGRPLPDSPHAVSVSMPSWADVVGYEENDPRVRNALACGYPRFVLHPDVCDLFALCQRELAPDGHTCIAFPTENSARRGQELLGPEGRGAARVTPFRDTGMWALCVPSELEARAMQVWQHGGEVISSRWARAVLDGTDGIAEAGGAARATVRERLGGLLGVKGEDVWLYSSGMGAIHAALRAAMGPGGRTVQFGFPYLDTLKLQQFRGARPLFLPRGDEGDLPALRAALEAGEVQAVFCELPSNPLLATPPLPAVSELTRAHGVPLIVDDTIATSVNVAALPYADVVVTSLTKFFSGAGDVMAGAMALNPASPLYAALRARVEEEWEETLWAGDAETLEANSRDFAARVAAINPTAEGLTDFLRARPEVAAVFYPKFVTPAAYDALKRPGGGYGGLFSVLLHNAEACTPRFYDALDVAKGPGLGTSFTLACPYTLLAHYTELDWAESCGVSRWLVRVSVGTEPLPDLIARFEAALAAATQGGRTE